MDQITALIADDDALARRALSAFLANAGVQVVAEASNGCEAIEAARSHRPHVALVDVKMPIADGVEATLGILSQSPGTRIIAVTVFGTVDSILTMLRAGASGYLLKDTEPEDIASAVHEVHSGSSVLSPRVTECLIASIRDTPVGPIQPLHDYQTLSMRESTVVRHLAHGFSNGEIALAMRISEGSVKAHLGSIMSKWAVRDRVQVLIRAARAGIVNFDIARSQTDETS